MRRLRCRYPFEPWNCTVCGARIEGRAPHSYLTGLACIDCVDRGMRGEPFIPLTVRDVKPCDRPEERAIVAVSMREGRCVTEAGEVFDLPGLVARVRERKRGERGRAGQLRVRLPDRLDPCFVVTDAGLDLLSYLDQSEAADSAAFNWVCGLREPSAWRPEAAQKSRTVFLVPKPIRFGYASRRAGARRATGRARWYELIDVPLFCESLGAFGRLDAIELLRFGVELRAWANRERLPVLTSASAYGSRLLRDARFGGGWRRKVPAATNKALRAKLPGNHYQLLTATDRTWPSVHKLDQRSAHHHAALSIQFPHADTLWADGWYRQRAPDEGSRVGTLRGAIPGLSDRWRELVRRPGVFMVAVSVSERVALDRLAIPALRQTGVRWRTLTSVELAHIQALRAGGAQIGLGDIWCCWTSPETDERLNELAWWALEQGERATPSQKRWLKPALLAAYGMLAARPRRFRNAWRQCVNSDGAIGFHARYGELLGYERSTKREREPASANVLWRALIESQVRLESLQMAQRLRGGGWRPVAVYADAVFAAGAGEPPAPAPWRYEGVIHDLTFETSARYRSREETRLPGSRRREDWSGHKGGRRVPALGPGQSKQPTTRKGADHSRSKQNQAVA